MNPVTPLVSVTCPAYNHEKYIAKALESFIMQKTDFPFEIIVHDDASTDNTVRIIKEYEAKRPDLFANIYQKDNQFSQGHDRVMQITFGAARGKYIALCEGDDYWVDPYKLQKQVSFLESNPDYNICCTNAYFIKEAEDFELLEKNIIVKTDNDDHTIEQEKILYENCILTMTAVFRNRKESLPKWIQNVQLGDWSVFILNSLSGKIRYLKDVTTAYRIHQKGIFSSIGLKKQLVSYINTGEIIRKNIPKEAAQKMIPGQRSRLIKLLDTCINQPDPNSLQKYLGKYFYLLTFRDKIKYSFYTVKSFAKKLLHKQKEQVQSK